MKSSQTKDSLKEKFKVHLWFSTNVLFLGEIIPLFFYIFIYKKLKSKKELNDQKNRVKEGHDDCKEETEQKPPIPTNLMFAITAVLDLLSTSSSNIGLIYLSSSYYQMMRGLLLAFICLWSKIFLKNPIYKHHILAVVSLIFGFILVGVSILINPYNSERDINPVFGMILIIISQLLLSADFVLQEKFIKNYDIHPCQLVGFEGLWGIIMFIIILIIFQFIPCKEKEIRQFICIKKSENEYYVEDSIFALKQMWSEKSILIIYIFLFISVALFNVFSINLTKLVSSTARAVVDNLRSVFVWLFFLFFEPVKGTKETFNFVEFIGLLFIVFGTLFYNEIIVLHFCGLDNDIRQSLVKRKKEELIKKLEEEDDEKKLYISVQGKDNIETSNENDSNLKEE